MPDEALNNKRRQWRNGTIQTSPMIIDVASFQMHLVGANGDKEARKIPISPT